jgi:hypothetical protein
VFCTGSSVCIVSFFFRLLLKRFKKKNLFFFYYDEIVWFTNERSGHFILTCPAKKKLTLFSFYFWQECNERIKRLGTFSISIALRAEIRIEIFLMMILRWFTVDWTGIGGKQKKVSLLIISTDHFPFRLEKWQCFFFMAVMWLNFFILFLEKNFPRTCVYY